MLVRDVMRKIVLPAIVMFVVGLLVLSRYHPSPQQPVSLTTPKVSVPAPSLLPDFARYQNVGEKKRAFFAYMLPMVERENQRLLKNRARLLELQSQLRNGLSISTADKKWLTSTAKSYRLDPVRSDLPSLIPQLLNRVDVVPPSLALSQSANESAWGTSRFALQANNLFGQWCFSKGCGVVPNQRPEGAIYEVARFSAPEGSVISYIHNLNTNSAYSYFRELRTSLRNNQLLLSGDVLAEGLISYSARGEEYINELRQMIRVNGLARYDQS